MTEPEGATWTALGWLVSDRAGAGTATAMVLPAARVTGAPSGAVAVRVAVRASEGVVQVAPTVTERLAVPVAPAGRSPRVQVTVRVAASNAQGAPEQPVWVTPGGRTTWRVPAVTGTAEALDQGRA